MPKTHSGFRYRLEPQPAQARWMAQAAGSGRWLWNWALAYRNDAWLAARSAGATGIAANLGYSHLCSLLTQLRQQHPWLQRTPVAALRGSLKNLDKAFQNFFKGTGAYPRFKRREDTAAVTFFDKGSIRVEGNWVQLPCIGWVRFRQHRPLEGTIRTVGLTREGGHWFISFSVEGTFTLPNKRDEAIGIDLGIAQSITLSTGEVCRLPVTTPKEEKRLRWLQRQASRRVKGSKRRRRTLAQAAKLKRHSVARRRDAVHKFTTRLATSHRQIAIEDLQVRNMTASAKGTVAEPGRNVRAKAGLNRSMLAQAPAEFRRILAYKCVRSGAQLIAVPPAYTSQTCSRCKHRARENRKSQAVFHCVSCGLHLNADLNAALNIKAAGLAVSAQGGSDSSRARELRTRPRAGSRKRPPGRREAGLYVIS